jgi:hypothetical protein
MTFQAAQQRYDNMLPDEAPDDHTYTGDVYLDKHGYVFRFEQGQIVTFDYLDAESDEGLDLPMSQYTGSDAILNEADEIAFGEWVNECQAVRDDF